MSGIMGECGVLGPDGQGRCVLKPDHLNNHEDKHGDCWRDGECKVLSPYSKTKCALGEGHAGAHESRYGLCWTTSAWAAVRPETRTCCGVLGPEGEGTCILPFGHDIEHQNERGVCWLMVHGQPARLFVCGVEGPAGEGTCILRFGHEIDHQNARGVRWIMVKLEQPQRLDVALARSSRKLSLHVVRERNRAIVSRLAHTPPSKILEQGQRKGEYWDRYSWALATRLEYLNSIPRRMSTWDLKLCMEIAFERLPKTSVRARSAKRACRHEAQLHNAVP